MGRVKKNGTMGERKEGEESDSPWTQHQWHQHRPQWQQQHQQRQPYHDGKQQKYVGQYQRNDGQQAHRQRQHQQPRSAGYHATGGKSNKRQQSGASDPSSSSSQPGADSRERNWAASVRWIPTVEADWMASTFLPPGCDAPELKAWGDQAPAPARRFEDCLARGFWCPPRLYGRDESLVEAFNDWHFAMLNDTNRNKFFYDALESLPVKGCRVIDIGAGTGLLSLMAARLGAESVLAIEASRDMVEMAKGNASRNGYQSQIRVIHNLSSRVRIPEADRADVIVSETFGALLLSEGCLDYFTDARKRLGRPGAKVIPAGGAQYAMLVSSPSLGVISSVQSSLGFDLSNVSSLQDTATLCFTKQWGFRLNSLDDFRQMSERICILDIDFNIAEREHIPQQKTYTVWALQDGQVHGVVASWEIWSDPERQNILTTHPEDTKDQPWGFARDMQWGQGLQLIEDYDKAHASDRNSPPKPFLVQKGEELKLTVRFSDPCRQAFQFTLRRASKA